VAPAVFRALPSRDAAGALIATVLRSVCLLMEIAFAVLFVTTGRLASGRRGRGDALLRRVPVLGFVAALAISFVVMPVLERLRLHPESDPAACCSRAITRSRRCSSRSRSSARSSC
jgi:hypothetical protein